MSKFVYTNLETAEPNPDGFACTLYFEGEPSEAEVRRVCDEVGTADTADPYFEWVEAPTPVSKRAGLRRYQAFPGR